MSIDVQSLSVRAGSSTLVHDVSLAIEPGTWCTLIGPNGAGKTSLVETIVGLRRASAGEVTIHGRSVAGLSERERARTVAFVPQNPVVPAGMTVATYVGLGRTAYHGVLRSAGATDRAIVSSVLERVGLKALADRDVASLSGGERQRTVLARALAQSTLVLVLDEPTTGLDVRHQIELLELVRTEVRECGLTVLATLHDLTLATQFADRLTLLTEGRVVDDGQPADVVRGPQLVKSYGLSFDVVTVAGADVVVPLRVRDASVHGAPG